jgi:hypothetical protein
VLGATRIDAEEPDCGLLIRIQKCQGVAEII